MSLRKLYYLIPPQERLLLRKIFFFPTDLWNHIFRKRAKYEPPKGDIYVGSGDFNKQGIHHLDLLIQYLDLKPEQYILDIGSGIGRTAAALTRYMKPKGQYEGFDVVEKGVKWCQNTIQKDFPNFNFTFVPLSNDLYNQSSNAAEDFTFPYKDGLFDGIFLFSVFTHMQPHEINHYLGEIHRTLKVGQKCLATFFLYSEDEKEYIMHQNAFHFPVDKGDYLLMHPKVKSANIAYQYDNLVHMVKINDLQIEKYVPGYWKNDVENSSWNDYQDIMILSKSYI